MKSAKILLSAAQRIGVAIAVASIVAGSPAVAQSTKLDDATVFAIFDQANMADITTGRLGAKMGHSEDVRAHGRAVATDHEGAQQMARDLARKLGVVPTPPASDTSQQDQAKAYAALQTKAGAEFDKAYILHEIAYHQSAIDAVKGTLLPAIKNEEIKAMMLGMLPAFEQHLAMTKAVAKKLGITP